MNVRADIRVPFDFDRLKSPPSGDFITSLSTYEHVYSLAAGLCASFAEKGDDSPVCLCSEDRAVILASLIASLFSRVPVVLPYSFSAQVLDEARGATGFRRIVADVQEERIVGASVIRPAPAPLTRHTLGGTIDPEDRFLYLFTGGSTGTPKLWEKTARNMFCEAAYQSRLFGIRPDDIVISTVPPYHIYGLLFSVLVPFVAGASVLQGIFVYPREICNALVSLRPTLFVSVPMHYRVLKGCDAAGHCLRLAFSSAGALDPGDADAFFSMTGTGVREIYGSTETGGIAWRCRAGGDASLRPFDVVSWRITDSRLSVRSDFISPGLPLDADGFFITGDRAAAAEGGTLQLLGRSDGIVKVGGKRVDLGDVQEKMKKIAGVTDAYLVSFRGRSGRESEIHALIEGTVDEAAVRREAAALLEPYAMPRRIRVVDRIPLLSTGKYDRKTIEEMLKL
ncbi:MAG: acyl--CoA ligase [Spirochaetes bacterium]|nr:acyl--CoA ligase [Spirochaetota bacterium]